MHWNFEIIKDIPEDFIKNSSNSHVFFQPSLIKAWLETYNPLRNLSPIFIKATFPNNEVFLPLVLWKKNWKNAFINSIIPVGYSDFDYHNPIFLNKPSKDEINSFWTDLYTFLKSNFKFDNITIEGITDNFISFDLSWEKGEICPSLDLKNFDSEEDLLKFLSTSLRGDIRRQMRRLNEIGELKLYSFNSWEDIPKKTFEEFMKQHSQKWPNAYKAPHFHENLLKEGLKSGIVDFSVLKSGEKEIAWHLGFKYKNRYYYYMPAGNAEFSKFSPVKVHLFLLINKAIESGFDVFDHLRGEENYKSGWSNNSQYVNIFRFESLRYSSKIKKKLLDLRRHIIK